MVCTCCRFISSTSASSVFHLNIAPSYTASSCCSLNCFCASSAFFLPMMLPIPEPGILSACARHSLRSFSRPLVMRDSALAIDVHMYSSAFSRFGRSVIASCTSSSSRVRAVCCCAKTATFSATVRSVFEVAIVVRDGCGQAMMSLADAGTRERSRNASHVSMLQRLQIAVESQARGKGRFVGKHPFFF
ncbi:hypothetical protein BKA62DRAFT_681872, partial [Auriculariales sp. MPI-PUGE-AT-0066]